MYSSDASAAEDHHVSREYPPTTAGIGREAPEIGCRGVSELEPKVCRSNGVAQEAKPKWIMFS